METSKSNLSITISMEVTGDGRVSVVMPVPLDDARQVRFAASGDFTVFTNKVDKLLGAIAEAGNRLSALLEGVPEYHQGGTLGCHAEKGPRFTLAVRDKRERGAFIERARFAVNNLAWDAYGPGEHEL